MIEHGPHAQRVPDLGERRPSGLIDQRELGQHHGIEEPQRPGEPLHRAGQLDLRRAHRPERVPGRQHVQVARPHRGDGQRPGREQRHPAANAGREGQRLRHVRTVDLLDIMRHGRAHLFRRRHAAPFPRGLVPRGLTPAGPTPAGPTPADQAPTDLTFLYMERWGFIWNIRRGMFEPSSVTSPGRHRGNPAPCPRRRSHPRPRAVHRLLHRGAWPAAGRARRGHRVPQVLGRGGPSLGPAPLRPAHRLGPVQLPGRARR